MSEIKQSDQHIILATQMSQVISIICVKYTLQVSNHDNGLMNVWHESGDMLS